MEQNKDKCSTAGAENAFLNIDVCKNDAIMRGELELVDLVLNHQTLDIGKSDQRVNQLFSELDLNDDGHITKEVWLANWQQICSVMPDLKDDAFNDKMSQLFSMCGPKETPLFAKGGVSTFFSKPLYGKPGNRCLADCVFFGCPFDAGSTYRSGNRWGPKTIREASQMLLTNCSSDYAPWVDKQFGKMRIFDAGDSAPTPFDLLTAVNQIYVYAKVLWITSSRVIGIGGDHTLSWSLLAAARDKNKGRPVPMIHLDAHLDTGDEYMGSKLSHGTSLGRAGAGGCINFARSIHIGIRGIVEGPELQTCSNRQGYRTITMDEFVAFGPVQAAKEAKKVVGNEPCVIILDLDVMDTSDCPGVGFPTPGGIRNRELFTFLRALRGLDVMGAAIVEYTPHHDPALATAMTAAQAAYEIMALALAETPVTDPENGGCKCDIKKLVLCESCAVDRYNDRTPHCN